MTARGDERSAEVSGAAGGIAPPAAPAEAPSSRADPREAGASDPAAPSPLPRPAPSPKVRVRLCRPEMECETIDPARISEVLGEPTNLVWVDIRDPGPAEFAMLAEEFHFHRLALEDAAKQRQRPKVDEYPGYFFAVAYAPLPTPPREEVRTAEVDMFVGRNYVVTLHRGTIPAMEEARRRWERTEPVLRGRVGFLVHTLMDSIIDAYFPIVDQLEDRVDLLEIALFQGDSRPQPEELLAIKASLFNLRKAIYPLREVFNTFLRRDLTLFSPDTYPYFQDVYDHVLRLLDTIDIQREMVTGLLDAHLTLISNRLNETMKTLTVVAICVAIMGAVFGAWGMNFDRIPLAHAPYGFHAVAGGTLILVGLALVWAKWRRLW